MKLRTILPALALATALGALAQTTREQMLANPANAAGVYVPYPVTEVLNTPAPKGYTPFYISHYGRHGSRYLIDDRDYRAAIDPLERAERDSALTPLGRDVLERARRVWDEARGRGGELTPLGARQHHDIAQRMLKAYPQPFADGADITAASTQVMRCAHSMFNFVQGLKELDPSLEIPMESSKRNMYYLCHSEPASWEFNDNKGRLSWRPESNAFHREKTRPDRLMASLFTDPQYVRQNIEPSDLMWALYWMAVDAPNMETPERFFDIFTPDELVDLWEANNFSFYATNASYPRSDGLNVDNAKNLLRNIVETADAYIADGRHGATLRFGHDGNIVPLGALMRLKGFHGYENDPAKVLEAWCTWQVAPMAANLQMVFFRDKAGDVIVKFMMNERELPLDGLDSDIYPFYRWDDARAYLMEAIDVPSINFCPAELRQ